jgi:ribosomal protein S16
MVRIRLRRIGLKHQPSYRIVAADIEAPRDGRFLEILGVYNPRTEPFTWTLKRSGSIIDEQRRSTKRVLVCNYSRAPASWIVSRA